MVVPPIRPAQVGLPAVLPTEAPSRVATSHAKAAEAAVAIAQAEAAVDTGPAVAVEEAAIAQAVVAVDTGPAAGVALAVAADALADATAMFLAARSAPSASITYRYRL